MEPLILARGKGRPPQGTEIAPKSREPSILEAQFTQTAERKSSLDLNDGRDAFGWVRSVHGEYTSIQQGLTVDCRVDPEGVYLNASQLGGNQFAIWPDEHDAENETN